MEVNRSGFNELPQGGLVIIPDVTNHDTEANSCFQNILKQYNNTAQKKKLGNLFLHKSEPETRELLGGKYQRIFGF